MPMIRTKAPSGSARTPYSVSPRRKLHRRGPKPRKNWVAFMPVIRAVTKCPVSWRKTEIRMPTTNTNIQMLTTASHAEQAEDADAAEGAGQRPPTSSSSGVSVTDPPAITSLRKRPYAASLDVVSCWSSHRSITSCTCWRRRSRRPIGRRRPRRPSSAPLASCRVERPRCTRQRSDSIGSARPGTPRRRPRWPRSARPARSRRPVRPHRRGRGSGTSPGPAARSRGGRAAPSRCGRTACRCGPDSASA